MPIQDGGANLLLGQFSPRLHENEKKMAQRGARLPYVIQRRQWEICYVSYVVTCNVMPDQ